MREGVIVQRPSDATFSKEMGYLIPPPGDISFTIYTTRAIDEFGTRGSIAHFQDERLRAAEGLDEPAVKLTRGEMHAGGELRDGASFAAALADARDGEVDGEVGLERLPGGFPGKVSTSSHPMPYGSDVSGTASPHRRQ